MELLLIVVSGLLMSAVALVGGLAAVFGEASLKRVMLPMVAVSAGSLIGAALFHMIPAAVDKLGNGIAPYLWVAIGFAVFFCLEQFLHWHHCHRESHDHRRPVTYLLLVADGVHNLVGGLAVGFSFMVDVRLGITTWLVEAAHELPQEIGDFGVLVHGGWSVKKALAYNFVSGLTFLVGGLMAYLASKYLSHGINIAFAIPFAAGNFLYIAAVDLVPEINKHHRVSTNLLHFACFLGGMTLLLLVSRIGHA